MSQNDQKPNSCNEQNTKIKTKKSRKNKSATFFVSKRNTQKEKATPFAHVCFTWSSPSSEKMCHSCEMEPPMAPAAPLAAAQLSVPPVSRPRIRLYASQTLSYVCCRHSWSACMLYPSFITNSLARSAIALGRASSRNLVPIFKKKKNKTNQNDRQK